MKAVNVKKLAVITDSYGEITNAWLIEGSLKEEAGKFISILMKELGLGIKDLAEAVGLGDILDIDVHEQPEDKLREELAKLLARDHMLDYSGCTITFGK